MFHNSTQFKKGKPQVAYYAKSQGLNEALYVVFVPNYITLKSVREAKNEMVDNVSVTTYIIRYNEEKDF